MLLPRLVRANVDGVRLSPASLSRARLRLRGSAYEVEVVGHGELQFVTTELLLLVFHIAKDDVLVRPDRLRNLVVFVYEDYVGFGVAVVAVRLRARAAGRRP